VTSRAGSAGLVLAGAALFGTIGTAQALGPEVPSPQLAAARLLLAAVLLVTVALVTRHAAGLTASTRHAPTWWAGLGQASFNLCFLGAMTEAGVAVGTLVAIGATPILTGLATRHVSRRWLVATGVAVAGLVLLVGGQLSTESVGLVRPSLLGILLALGASASYATYIIAGNAAAARGLQTQPYLATAFTLSAAVTAPLLVGGDIAWLWTGGGSLLVAYLAIVPTVVAYSLFNRGLHGVRPSTASTLGLIEPVVAACLAFVLLGERLSVVGVLGACLVMVGLLLIVRSAGRSAAAPSVEENATRV
jgi:DME family drug/metabolite transporter